DDLQLAGIEPVEDVRVGHEVHELRRVRAVGRKPAAVAEAELAAVAADQARVTGPAAVVVVRAAAGATQGEERDRGRETRSSSIVSIHHVLPSRADGRLRLTGRRAPPSEGSYFRRSRASQSRSRTVTLAHFLSLASTRCQGARSVLVRSTMSQTA